MIGDKRSTSDFLSDPLGFLRSWTSVPTEKLREADRSGCGGYGERQQIGAVAVMAEERSRVACCSRRWLWVVVGGGLLAVVDVGLRWLRLAARGRCELLLPSPWVLVWSLAGSVVAGGGSVVVFGLISHPDSTRITNEVWAQARVLQKSIKIWDCLQRWGKVAATTMAKQALSLSSQNQWGLEWTRKWEREYSGDTWAIKNWEIRKEND